MRRPGTLLAFGSVSALIGIGLGVGLSQRGGDGNDPLSFARGSPYVKRSSVAMATRIDAYLPRKQADLAQIVFETFEDVDARMSEWKPTSPLSEVNAAAGKQAVKVPADLRAVIDQGTSLGRLTGGAFDITWAALWGLWDFKAAEPRLPHAARLRAHVRLVNYRDVEVNAQAGTVRLRREHMKIGLGAIAKGHALDVAAARLRDKGARSFMISSGGQVLVAGRHGKRAWRVGIRDPRGAPDVYFGVLELNNTSVSTSGDYESFFVRDGVRYHHILDPRTGMPARGLRSATVICVDATRADALSTAVMVMGPQHGLALIQQLEGVEAVLMDASGKILATPGARKLLRLQGRWANGT